MKRESNQNTNNQEDNFSGGINLDYDYNTEYGDGDIPEIDLPSSSNAVEPIPYEFPTKDGSGRK